MWWVGQYPWLACTIAAVAGFTFIYAQPENWVLWAIGSFAVSAVFLVRMLSPGNGDQGT